MDPIKEPKKVPLAGEVPEVKLPEPEPPKVIDLTSPKDYSHLPTGTQVSINLDKKSTTPSTPVLNNTNNIVPKSVLNSDYSKKFFKIALGILGAFFACFIIFLILSVTNIDTKFIKINLNGRITDANTGEPVGNAAIFLGESEIAKTNDDGIYSASNLDYGDAQITVKADGYDELTETVKITKVLLDYSTRKDFSLKSSLTGVLSGKFIPNTTNYKFTNDQLIIGEKQYKINDDGSFSIPNIKVGETTFKFSSSSFKDITQEITVISGTNQIPEITLVPGGDIVGELKSYVKEDLVLNTKFYVENILQDQVSISEDGKFAVKDLDISKRYKIRVTADGYKTRDYEINITQGENQLFNFRIVEEGVAIYPIREGESISDPKKVYRADFDGQNKVEISNDNKIDYLSKFYSIEDQTLYFQSTSNSAYPKTGSGGALNMPYSLSLASGIADRMTINVANLNELKANFISMKMLNVSVVRIGSQNRFSLQVMDMNGSNRKDIKVLDAPDMSFKDLKISNNGQFVMYGFKNGDQDELYQFNIDSLSTKAILQGKKVQLFDISEDGNLVLASRENPNTGLVDLVLINVATDDLRTLKENIKGFGYQFQKGSNNIVIFFEERESRSNIYTYTIDRSQEERITSLTPDYEIDGIYQESNLLFYYTNRGLLVVDINKPKNFKLVDASAFNYF